MKLYLNNEKGSVFDKKGLPWSYAQVTGKLTALKGLDARLQEIRAYLDLVIDEKLPLNHEILYHLQVN